MDNKTRTRNWATIVYQESAPENWREILADQHIPAFISPYHDRDINPGGEPKKPHWHVMLMFEGVKTREQVQREFSKIGGVGCEMVQSIRGYARYLCHLDNPEKARYNEDDVQALGGADYYDTTHLPTDDLSAIDEMMDYIDQNEVTSYYRLVRYCREYNREWFRVLARSGTYVIKEYIKSMSWELGGLGGRRHDLRIYDAGDGRQVEVSEQAVRGREK